MKHAEAYTDAQNAHRISVSDEAAKAGFETIASAKFDRLGDAQNVANLIDYTVGQMHEAYLACRRLVLAYELANEENGGFGSVEWSEIDDAHSAARDALEASTINQLKSIAREQNGYGDEE